MTGETVQEYHNRTAIKTRLLQATKLLPARVMVEYEDNRGLCPLEGLFTCDDERRAFKQDMEGIEYLIHLKAARRFAAKYGKVGRIQGGKLGDGFVFVFVY